MGHGLSKCLNHICLATIKDEMPLFDADANMSAYGIADRASTLIDWTPNGHLIILPF